MVNLKPTEFQVSKHKAKLAQKLLKDEGVLGKRDPKRGRPFSNKIQIKEFYRKDQYSRLLPGRKDYKSVKEELKHTKNRSAIHHNTYVSKMQQLF